MPIFKELNPQDCWAAIEGHQDVLTAEAQKMDSFYRAHKCPRCKSELQKEFDARHTFSDPDVMVPRALLRCPICRYLHDPHSNIVVEYGDASKIPLERIPLINPEK